jgi:hypothetical protein
MAPVGARYGPAHLLEQRGTQATRIETDRGRVVRTKGPEERRFAVANVVTVAGGWSGSHTSANLLRPAGRILGGP